MTSTKGSHASQPSDTEILNKHYDYMMSVGGNFIYTTDMQGFYTQVSQSVQTILGYAPREILNHHYSEFIDPEWKQRVLNFYQCQMRYLTPQTVYEFPMLTKSGDLLWVEQVVIPILENQRLKGFHAHVHNLENHHQIEGYLLETADRFFGIAQNAGIALFVVQDEQLVYVNLALEQLVEREDTSLLYSNILDIIHPDNHQAVINILQIDELSAEKHLEVCMMLNSGKERWVELSLSLSEFEHRPAIVGTAFDITERKNAELELTNYVHRLEIIQKVDNDLTTLLKFDHVLKIALDAAVDITHADAGAIHVVDGDSMRVAQVIGNFPQTMIGSLVATDSGIVGRVFHSQKPELVSDVQTDPDYVINVVETRAQMTIPLIVQDRLIGVLNVQTTQPDIFTVEQFDFLKMLTARIASALENARLYLDSQQHLLEVQELYEKVSGLEQMKTQMIRVAAHDLRNPLGVISGYLQMLGWELETALTDRNREQLHIIQQAVERIDKITRDILTLERVNAKQELPKEQVNLCDIVTTTCKEYGFQAQEKSLDFQINIPNEPALIQGDRILLHETIGNLISNAIKYTPENGQVLVQLWNEAGKVIFEVHDTGYGIPQDQQENLFKPFFRVTLKETRTIKGTGLGLHLVKNIIEQHQGQMHFSSTYEKGSTFGFEIPLFGKSKRRVRKNDTAS